jgi:hypothetical protein
MYLDGRIFSWYNEQVGENGKTSCLGGKGAKFCAPIDAVFNKFP